MLVLGLTNIASTFWGIECAVQTDVFCLKDLCRHGCQLPGWPFPRKRTLTNGPLLVVGMISSSAQRTQYPLIKEYTLNYRGPNFIIIYGKFLN